MKTLKPIVISYRLSKSEVSFLDSVKESLNCNNRSKIISEMVIFFKNNATKKDVKKIVLNEENITQVGTSIDYVTQILIEQLGKKHKLSNNSVVRYAIKYAKINNFIRNF